MVSVNMVSPGIWTWTICMTLTICHWSSVSHAFSAGGDLAATSVNNSTSATAPATNNNSSPILLKPVYTEGGAVLTNAASGQPNPESAHLSKKRVLSQAPVDTPLPAPVQEIQMQPVNATTAKNAAAVSSMERPLQAVNITSSSSSTTTEKPPSSTVKVLLTATTTTTTNTTTHLVNGTTTLPNVTSSGTVNDTATTIRPTTTSTTSRSSSSSSSSTTTTTTTTPKPKKPTITVSLNDDPSIVHVPSLKTVPSSGSPVFHSNSLDVEEPIAQLSRENLYDDNNNARVRNSRRDLVIPVVSLIFTIPMILGLLTIVVRKFRDYWHTRHYRRMDFLVDGIYND